MNGQLLSLLRPQNHLPPRPGWANVEGLKAGVNRVLKGRRFYVHLSSDEETAITIGKRYSKPVVFTIEAGQMHEGGFPFYRPTEGLWLTDVVPVLYIRFLEGR